MINWKWATIFNLLLYLALVPITMDGKFLYQRARRRKQLAIQLNKE